MEESVNQPRPTNAELAILQVLWQTGEGTVRDVHEVLSAQRDTGYTTVLKTMQIMVEKGLLHREEQGRAHVYRPTIPAFDAKQGLVGDLMERAFGGSARELVMHALNAKPATQEELNAIRTLIDEMEARGG